MVSAGATMWHNYYVQGMISMLDSIRSLGGSERKLTAAAILSELTQIATPIKRNQ
jgi:hypothetical protein